MASIDRPAPQPLAGGVANRGHVVRIGDRVHRPRRAGAQVTEALLTHLEEVGFAGAPRFRGHDEQGRQVLTYLEGHVAIDHRPPWQTDDAANAAALGELAALARRVHEATAGFVPPAGAEPFRPLPTPGVVWCHGDLHYGNVVYAVGTDGTPDPRRPLGLIDWECCAPSDPLYDPASLMLSARCPRADRQHEHERRVAAARLAANAVLDGYGADDEQRARFPSVVAAVLLDSAEFVEEQTQTYSPATREQAPARLRWTARWWLAEAAATAGSS